MEIFSNPLVVPLGAFLMVIIIVAISQFAKMREKELAAHQELQAELERVKQRA